MLPNLNLHFAPLRIDWPLLLSALAVGIALLAATTTGLQMRRTRKRVLGTLERVFEQLDLLRLDALEAGGDPGSAQMGRHASTQAPAAAAGPSIAAPVASAGASAGASPRQPQPPMLAPASLADYQSAARLAAHGAPLAEIAERCGVVAAEARVLLALQQRTAAPRRRGNA